MTDDLTQPHPTYAVELTTDEWASVFGLLSASAAVGMQPERFTDIARKIDMQVHHAIDLAGLDDVDAAIRMLRRED